MACFHFHVDHVKRSAGQCVSAMAAYRSCSKIYSEYYHETYNYSDRKCLVHSEIMLPDYVPEVFKNREYLWDSVEYIEKRNDAQLAYNFDFTLQNEFTNEENIEIARRFIQENFVERGMICDWSFHYPNENDADENKNPHIHLLCPIRPMNKDGTWGEKQKAVLLFDENGNPILNEKGRQKTKAVKTTDWSDAETLVEWRKNWAEINNEMFQTKGLPQRISADTLEAQGLDLLPTIHEGPNVRAMEEKGIVTEKGEYNRWVRIINMMIIGITTVLNELLDWVKETKEITPPKENIFELISKYFKGRDYQAYSRKAKAENFRQQSVMVSYMHEKNIFSISDLESEIHNVQSEYDEAKEKKAEIGKQIDELNRQERILQRWPDLKKVGDEYEKKMFKYTRDNYYSSHKKDIDSYFYYKKNQSELINNPDAQYEITEKLKSLNSEQEKFAESLDEIAQNLDSLKRIQHCIDVAKGNGDNVEPVEIFGQTVYVEKSNTAGRKSLLKSLEEAKEQVKREDEKRYNSRIRSSKDLQL